MAELRSKSNIDRLTTASYRFFNNILALLIIFLLLRLFDAFVLVHAFNFSHEASLINIKGLVFDVYTVLKIAGFLILPYLLLSMLRDYIAEFFFVVVGVLLILVSVGLQLYFATTKIPLGSDLYGYSTTELKEVLSSTSSFSLINAIPFIAFPLLFIASRHYIVKLKFGNWVYYIFYPILIVALVTSGYSVAGQNSFGSRFNATVASNKLGFFTIQSFDYLKELERIHLAETQTALDRDSFMFTKSKSVSKDYPLLRADENHNVLGPFFDTSKVRPNIVFIIVESLGRAYSGKGAELGSYTPFLDSLSDRSLYFENFLSTAGRTFAVLPSLLASLPFNVHGFADMGDFMPNHNSIIKYLKANGYRSAFVYGGDARFDNMGMFMKKQGVDSIIDLNASWGKSLKLPPNDRGFSWGYGDAYILQQVVNRFRKDTIPSAVVALTLAMHDPFRVHNEQSYNARFRNLLSRQPIPNERKKYLEEYEKQLSTVLYFDDALRQFFIAFEKLPAYRNTIFVITGDHRMPEIPIATAIDRFRVPLVIYSPMLTRTARFSSVSTQFDVTPSLAALLHAKGEMSFPKYVSWVGIGLDTARAFRNKHSVPLMENKNGQTTFLDGNYFISMGKLYSITPKLSLKDEDDPKRLEEMQKKLDDFKNASIFVCSKNRIIPDSLVAKAVSYSNK